MPIEVKHATQATGTDAGNGEIRKAQWNEGHTLSMDTNKLLGRSTAGAGAAEEISIGSGLSLSAGTLSASGGASTLTFNNITAAYTVVAADLGRIINCTSGTFTVSLTSTTTLGTGFNCWIWNTSSTATDVITIDPSGVETIDGAATLLLRRGEGVQIITRGPNWETGDKKTIRGYAENISSTSTRPIASGAGAVAIGWGASASGSDSMAAGRSATASGNFCFAGPTATASSSNSVALGMNSGSNGSQAVTSSAAMALGGAYASGIDSLAAASADNTSTYGARNTSTVAIGFRSRATATYSLGLGANANASGGNAVAIGGGQFGGPSASGSNSVCIGTNHNLSNPGASGPGSISLGDGSSTLTNAVNSVAVMGGQTSVFGQYAYAGGDAGSSAQTSTYVLKRSTLTATPAVMCTNRINTTPTPSATNQIALLNNSAVCFQGIVVARQQAVGGTQSAAWKVEGLIRREGSAGTTTLVASSVTAISNVPGWALALSADTTFGALAVTVTGAAATNIYWVATIETSEATYA